MRTILRVGTEPYLSTCVDFLRLVDLQENCETISLPRSSRMLSEVYLSFAGQKPALHSDEGPASYRMFLDSLPFIMWLFDKRGRCLFQNKAALDYTGIAQENGLGSGWLECVHPDDRARMVCERLESISQNEPRRIEHRLRRANGEYRWFLATIVPVDEPSQCFTGYLVSATDITDQKDKFDSLHQSEARY